MPLCERNCKSSDDNCMVPSLEELEQMALTDIREIDPSTLVDISEIKINTSLSHEDRILDYFRQIKNPYCYLDHGIVVKVSFCGKKRLEDCIIDSMQPFSQK